LQENSQDESGGLRLMPEQIMAELMGEYSSGDGRLAELMGM